MGPPKFMMEKSALKSLRHETLKPRKGSSCVKNGVDVGVSVLVGGACVAVSLGTRVSVYVAEGVRAGSCVAVSGGARVSVIVGSCVAVSAGTWVAVSTGACVAVSAGGSVGVSVDTCSAGSAYVTPVVRFNASERI